MQKRDRGRRTSGRTRTGPAPVRAPRPGGDAVTLPVLPPDGLPEPDGGTHVGSHLDLIAAELAAAKSPCATTSFQADGVVLLHMLLQQRPDLPVLFVDTLHHFEAVLEYKERLVREWGINLVELRAPEGKPGLWQTSTDACCKQHKSGPLFGALEGYDVWFSALRRGQSRSRAALTEVAPFRLPSGTTLRKVSPLANWTAAEIAAYATVHEIPLLPLYEIGYTSIGCEPCTVRPLDPNDPRSGRWMGEKLECGIHLEFLGDAKPEDGGSGR